MKTEMQKEFNPNNIILLYTDKIIKYADKIKDWFKYDALMPNDCILCSRFRKDNKRSEITNEIEKVLKSAKTENFNKLFNDLCLKYSNIHVSKYSFVME